MFPTWGCHFAAGCVTAWTTTRFFSCLCILSRQPCSPCSAGPGEMPSPDQEMGQALGTAHQIFQDLSLWANWHLELPWGVGVRAPQLLMWRIPSCTFWAFPSWGSCGSGRDNCPHAVTLMDFPASTSPYRVPASSASQSDAPALKLSLFHLLVWHLPSFWCWYCLTYCSGSC